MRKVMNMRRREISKKRDVKDISMYAEHPTDCKCCTHDSICMGMLLCKQKEHTRTSFPSYIAYLTKYKYYEPAINLLYAYFRFVLDLCACNTRYFPCSQH